MNTVLNASTSVAIFPMKKLVILIAISAVLGIVVGVAITWFSFMGAEESFINWAPEGARYAR